MTAFNIVRFRVWPSRAIHCGAPRHKSGLKGFREGYLVRTGEEAFCFIGEWASFQKIVGA